MIDATIPRIGRTLVFAWLGAMKINATRAENFKQDSQRMRMQIYEQESNMKILDDISFQATSKVIDKRFKASKQFLETGIGTNLQMRKRASITDKNIMNLMQQNALKAKIKYNNSVSRYNKRRLDNKAQSSFRLIDFKKVV